MRIRINATMLIAVGLFSCEMPRQLPDFTKPLIIESPSDGIRVGRGELPVSWQPAPGFPDYLIVYRYGNDEELEKSASGSGDLASDSFPIDRPGLVFWTIVGDHELGRLQSIESGISMQAPRPRYPRRAFALDVSIESPEEGLSVCVPQIPFQWQLDDSADPQLPAPDLDLELSLNPFPFSEAAPADSTWRVDTTDSSAMISVETLTPPFAEGQRVYWRLVHDDESALPFYSEDSGGPTSRSIVYDPAAQISALSTNAETLSCSGTVTLTWPGISTEAGTFSITTPTTTPPITVSEPQFNAADQAFSVELEFAEWLADSTYAIEISKCGSQPRTVSVTIESC